MIVGGEMMNAFGDIIRKKREYLGWTQKQLAEKLYVSNKTVSRWENNQGYPDIELLPAITKALDLNYEELLDGQEYIIAKQRHRRQRMKMICCLLAFCIVLGGIFYYIRPQNNHKTTARDLLLSEEIDLGYIHLSRHYDFTAQIDKEQKKQLLTFLNIDEWQSIPLNSFSKNDNISPEWGMIYHIDEQQYNMNYYIVEGHYYMIFEFYDGRSYEVYEVPHALGKIDDFVIQDIYNWYGFYRDHQLEIKSSSLKELSYDEYRTLTYDYRLSKSILEDYGYVFIEDQTNQKYYFIFAQSEYNIHKLITHYQQGVFNMELIGEKYRYQKPYIHVFEILQSTSQINIRLNQKEISPIMVYHISYAAQPMNEK